MCLKNNKKLTEILHTSKNLDQNTIACAYQRSKNEK